MDDNFYLTEVRTARYPAKSAGYLNFEAKPETNVEHSFFDEEDDAVRHMHLELSKEHEYISVQVYAVPRASLIKKRGDTRGTDIVYQWEKNHESNCQA